LSLAAVLQSCEFSYSKNGTAIPAAARRFWTNTGPFVGAARPDELADAALPVAEAALDVVLTVPEADEEELVSKLF